MTADASLSDANLTDQLDAWAKKLSDTAQSIRRAGNVSMDHRVTASAAAQDILKTVQSPIEHLMGSMILMVQFAAMRLFVKWKVFETIPIQGSISYKDLASKVGADEALIRKFIWSEARGSLHVDTVNRTLCMDPRWQQHPSPTGIRLC